MSSCTLAIFIYVNEIRLPFLLQDPGNELYLKSLELSAKVFYFNSLLSLLCFHYLILYCTYVSKLPFLFPLCHFQYRGLFFLLSYLKIAIVLLMLVHMVLIHVFVALVCLCLYECSKTGAFMNTRYMEDLL